MWFFSPKPSPPPLETYPVSDIPPLPKLTVLSPPVPLSLLPEHEPRLKRILFHLIAIAIVIGYAYFLFSFTAPAPCRPGIDENAYLVGGRMIADHFSPSYKPPHPLSFTGAMWVLSPKTGLYYPKYPAGLPLLYAIPFFFTSHANAVTAAFYLSPLCATLSAYFMFLLSRRVVGSFLAILSTLVLATGVTTLQLAQIPNSHLPALFFATAGMYFLLRSVQTSRARWGIIGGLLLGYAFTIRYSQGLMLLPVAAAALFLFLNRRKLPNRSFRATLLQPASLLIAWALPVATLCLFNYFTLGHFTGYGATRESSGFTYKEFLDKWEFAVAQLYNFGLFFVAPVGLVGLFLLFRRSVRVASLLFLWFVPGTLLYFSYYWGQHAPGVGFLRFFLDLYPPLIIAAFWLLRSASLGVTPNPQRKGSLVIPVAAAILCAAPAAIGTRNSIPEMERQHLGNLNLAFSADQLNFFLQRAPRNTPQAKPVIFADEGLFPQFLMYGQFTTDADWYAADAFQPRFGGGFGIFGPRKNSEKDNPVLIQDERRQLMEDYYKARSGKDLLREQRDVITKALDQDRPVYFLINPTQLDQYKSTILAAPFEYKDLSNWTEPAGDPDKYFPKPDPFRPGPAHPLAPPSWRMNLVINWSPQTRHLLQITRQSPAPATQPTTRP